MQRRLLAPSNVMPTERAYATDPVRRCNGSRIAFVEGTAHARKAKSARVRVLLNYMQSQDRLGMAAAYNFYLGSVLPGLPFPKSEQVVDAQNTTAAESPKAAEVRIENIIDPSFVQSSADRGLYKP
jgi:hypothetical protein